MDKRFGILGTTIEPPFQIRFGKILPTMTLGTILLDPDFGEGL